MNIPDEVVEAAAEAFGRVWDDETDGTVGDCIRAAIEAAMPAIREAIAQEVERSVLAVPSGGPTKATAIAQVTAARIVRGGADAIEAAMPAIREALAQEIEAHINYSDTVFGQSLHVAADIARGGAA